MRRDFRHKLTREQVDYLRAIVRDVSKQHLHDCAMRMLLGTLNYPKAEGL
jgi:hypothetical protein